MAVIIVRRLTMISANGINKYTCNASQASKIISILSLKLEDKPLQYNFCCIPLYREKNSIMGCIFVKIVFVLLLGWSNFSELEAGNVTNYNIDPNCPDEVIMYELRITDCDELPCTIRREKMYTIEGDFGVTRNVSVALLKCSSVYLGRHIDLPGHGGCDNLSNGSCPLVVGERYTSATTFKIPYYVPPMLYTVYCSFVDENDENMMCGWGSSRVV